MGDLDYALRDSPYGDKIKKGGHHDLCLPSKPAVYTHIHVYIIVCLCVLVYTRIYMCVCAYVCLYIVVMSSNDR